MTTKVKCCDTENESDEFGIKQSEKLVRAYSDVESNRKFITENWPSPSFDPNTPLLRFTTVEHLKTMLQTKMNYLASVLTWKDVYEGLTRNIILQDQYKNPIGWSSITTSFYGQCWTMTEFDSELLWNARCPDISKNGVCIRSTFAKLVKNFIRHFGLVALESGNVAKCSMVEYLNDKSIKAKMRSLQKSMKDSAGMVLRTSVLLDYLMMKRISFKDENEVRLILDGCVIDGRPLNSVNVKAFTRNAIGISYQIDPRDFIDEIIIDPRLSTTETKKVIGDIKRLVSRYGWKSGRSPVKVRQSDLYRIIPQRKVVTITI